jgi:hypothetical protein
LTVVWADTMPAINTRVDAKANRYNIQCFTSG